MSGGHCWRLDRDIMSNQVAWLLMRLDRDTLGRSAARKKSQLQRAVFFEGDGFLKRHHSHIIIERLGGMSEHELKIKVAALWRKSHWGYKQIDSRRCYEKYGLMKYNFKEGVDALDTRNTYFNKDSCADRDQ